MDTKAFDARRYLTKLKGKDCLEVKWRLVWLRSEHPDAAITTELALFTPELAVVKASVSIPKRRRRQGPRHADARGLR